MAVSGAEPLSPLLLRAKLTPPPIPDDVVLRPALLTLLDQSQTSALTLVSAPAGWGKTTLLASWLAQHDGPSAWLSLDEQENNLTAFVRALVACLQTIDPAAGRTTLSLLQLPELPPIAYIADTLAEELADLPSGLTLVLDDYHTIDDAQVHALLARLVTHGTANIRLLVGTRHDPPLPLGALRAGRQLTEIGADELRFAIDEAGAFLQTALATELPKETVAALHERTEGWIAGLRLAVLTLRQLPDRLADLEALSEGGPHARAYLLEQVFLLQTAEVQKFLLTTAICERFSAPLYDALLGRRGHSSSSQALLDRLAGANLFLVPLGAERVWYRYHHLFRDMLRGRLRSEMSSRAVAVLHRRASSWFEEQGLIDEAVLHALAGEAAQQAAKLVETYGRVALNREDWSPLERWLRLLPAELVESRPGLLLARAWTYHFRSRFGALPPILNAVETLLTVPDSKRDEAEVECLRAELDTLWAVSAFATGDAATSHDRARRALGDLGAAQAFASGVAAAFFGMASQLLGESATAVQQLTVARAEAAGALAVYDVRIVIAVAYIHLASGALQLVDQASREIVSVAADHDLAVSLAWGHYFLARVAYEWDRPSEASEHCQAVLELRHRAHHQTVSQAMLVLALAEQALGHPVAARQAVNDLIAFSVEAHDPPRLTLAQSFTARLALLQGDFTAAADWLRVAPNRGPATSAHEIEDPRLTRARVPVATGGEAAAAPVSLLAELASACEARHDIPRLIEVLALQALALQQAGEISRGVESLNRAVELAKPGGFIRTFVDLGAPLARLLSELIRRSDTQDYAVRLLAAFGGSAHSLPRTAPGRESTTVEMVEPLTNRELDVLELLAGRLTNKEAGSRLHISWQTVTKHTANVYQKLGVSGRREAVTRARALGILP